MKRQLIIALTAVLIIAAACFAGGSYYFLHPTNENRIVSLEVPPYSEDITLNVGETEYDRFINVIFENGFSVSDIKFESSDESVAMAQYTFTDRNRYVCFKIQAKSAGEAEIYFSADGGNIVSEKIKVNVTEEKKPGTQLSAESGNATESALETTPGTDAESGNNAETKGDTVYISPSGKRYHYIKSCAGKNGTKVKKSEAVSRGKTPCKKCADR